MLTVDMVNKIERELRHGDIIDSPITSMERISLENSKFTLSWHNEPFPDKDVVSRAIVAALYPDHPIKTMDFDWYMENKKMFVVVTLG